MHGCQAPQARQVCQRGVERRHGIDDTLCQSLPELELCQCSCGCDALRNQLGQQIHRWDALEIRLQVTRRLLRQLQAA